MDGIAVGKRNVDVSRMISISGCAFLLESAVQASEKIPCVFGKGKAA
jgi:hypothetical protein